MSSTRAASSRQPHQVRSSAAVQAWRGVLSPEAARAIETEALGVYSDVRSMADIA